MADSSKPLGEYPVEARASPAVVESTVDFIAESTGAAGAARLSNRFAIERLHAQGGLGRVSLANDNQLKRPVAVKEIRPDRRSAEARHRFINEAEITGSLEHPGIVPIYALESDANGEPYYVMRFIQGRPLSDAVREYHARPTHLAFRELLQRFTSVCQTIAYAHSRGVLHRDLKPANVMLGEFGETLIVDWGLAKRMTSSSEKAASAESSPVPPADASQESTHRDEASEPTRPFVNQPFTEPSPDAPLHTETGQVLGTPAFMAPEQAAGRWDEVGPASDIYSLGAMLYVLLCGKPAVQAANFAELLSRVERGEYPAPRQVKSNVPRPLEAICLKAMARQPSQRFATASALAEDIEHWLADESVAAYAEPWSARAGRWMRKRRALVGSAAALLITALVATSIGLVFVEAERARTQNALSRVTDEEQKTKGALAKELQARQRTQQALDTLTDSMLERLLTRQTHISDEERAYLREVQQFYQEFAADTGNSEASRLISASGHVRVASIRASLNEFQEAESGYRDAISLFEKLVADYPTAAQYKERLSNAHNNLSFMLHELGRFAESERECRRAASLCDELIAAEPQSSTYRQKLSASYINLGRTLGAQGMKDDEIAEFRRARRLLEKLVADEPRVAFYRDQLALTNQNIGWSLKRRGKAAEAIPAYQEAINLRKQLVVDSPGDAELRSRLAIAQSRLANLFREQGRRAEAEPIYLEVFDVLEKLAAEFPIVREYRSELAGNYGNFAGLVRENGKPEDSLKWFTKEIELLEPMLKRQPDLLAERQYLRNAHWGRALALDQLYRRDEALRDWDRAVELSTDEEKSQIQMPRAASLAGAGRYKEAVEQAGRLVEGASAGIKYDAACVHALASAAVKDEPMLKEQYAARSVELLHQAKDGGLFRNPAMVEYIRTDNDLIPLREREDFKSLLAELAMPKPSAEK